MRTFGITLVVFFIYSAQSSAQLWDGTYGWFKAPIEISTDFYEGWPAKIADFEGVMKPKGKRINFKASSSKGIAVDLGKGAHSLRGKFKANLRTAKKQEGQQTISGSFTPTHYRRKGSNKWKVIESSKLKLGDITISYKVGSIK